MSSTDNKPVNQKPNSIHIDASSRVHRATTRTYNTSSSLATSSHARKLKSPPKSPTSTLNERKLMPSKNISPLLSIPEKSSNITTSSPTLFDGPHQISHIKTPNTQKALSLSDNKSISDISPQGTHPSFNFDTTEEMESNTETLANLQSIVSLHTVQIEERKGEIQYITRKIRRMEDDSIFGNSPTTTDPQIHIAHLEKQKEIFDRIEAFEETIEEHNDKIQHMTRMKDDAFQKIAEVRYLIIELQEKTEKDQLENEKFLRMHKDKLNSLTQVMNDQSKSHRTILSKIQEHELKLNATGSLSMTSPFQIVVDSDKYPILKSATNHHSHFSSLPKTLMTIALKGDDISAVQHFYDTVNTAFMTTLSSNTFLPDYVDLPMTFDFKNHLLPDPMHTKYNEALNIFKNMSRSLLHHLQNQTTIPPQQAPRAALILQENALEPCGFELMFSIIGKLSPQLGGHARDLEVYVNTLKVSDGEPVLDFYIRALKMYNEISLQKDSTGQQNRLIRRFVSLLFAYAPFTECLRPVMTELRKFFLLPDNHLQQFSITLPLIYQEHLRDKCAPYIISHKSSNKIHTPVINMLNINDPHDTENEDQIEDLGDHQQQDPTMNQDDKSYNEEDYINDENLKISPQVNAARYITSDRPTPTSSNTSYSPSRCVVCGLTQKECHQNWRNLHDPNDPTKCPFRGPTFITDKQIRERVLQYNIKHPLPPAATSTASTGNITKTTPPSHPSLPPPKASSVFSSDLSIDTSSHIDKHVLETPSTTNINTQNQDQVSPIASLLRYIEANIPSIDEKQLHRPQISMMSSQSSTTMENFTSPSSFYRLQE